MTWTFARTDVTQALPGPDRGAAYAADAGLVRRQVGR
jgi:hypothetical protein